MSTTEHTSITEQKDDGKNPLNTFFKKESNEFIRKLEEKQTLLEPIVKAYDLVYSKENTELVSALNIINHDEYNNVTSMGCYHLSNKFRLKLKRDLDAYHKFHCVLYPGERIEKAVLYKSVYLPKDSKQRDAYLNDVKIDDFWRYCSDHSEIHYVPIKTVIPSSNSSNSFSFFDKPLYMFDPFCGLSVEIHYKNARLVENRVIAVQQYVLNSKTRSVMLNQQRPNPNILYFLDIPVK